jgi:hypothetical protein
MKTSFLILLALLTASSLLRGQQPAGTWRHFINSTNPRDMIVDGEYLWIATDGGLVKFSRDSGTFILYTTDNSGLPDNALFRLDFKMEPGPSSIIITRLYRRRAMARAFPSATASGEFGSRRALAF